MLAICVTIMKIHDACNVNSYGIIELSKQQTAYKVRKDRYI